MPPHRIRKLPRVPSAQPPPPPQQPRLPKQEYLKLEAIWRGYGPGSNNNRGGRTLAAREAQLAADAKKLVSERELLRVREQDVERLQRETATRSAQSVGISSWAHEFVFGEEGEIMETPMKRSIASMARMLDTGLVDKAAASNAAAAKELQASIDPAQLAVLDKGASVWYLNGDRMVPSTIMAVHTDEPVPYYTIKEDWQGYEPGYERQTERVKIVPM